VRSAIRIFGSIKLLEIDCQRAIAINREPDMNDRPIENPPFRFPPQVFGQSFWIGFALCSAIALTITAYFWIVDHPHPLNWDEAYYLNRVSGDLWKLEHLGKRRFLAALFREDATRPPLYRWLAFPCAFLFGVHPIPLRLTALSCFWVSVGAIYLTAQRLAGATAGVFAVFFLMLSPRILESSKAFLTEYPLYLTLAATIYFLFRDWGGDAKPGSWSWIGLGVALGLGVLAKVTFVAIAAPMLLLAAILSGFRIVRSPSVLHLAFASSLGLAILAPWWWLNYRPALGFARFSADFMRSSVGPKGEWGTIVNWMSVVVQAGLGIPLALLALMIVILFGYQLARKQVAIDRTQMAALGVCLAGCLPLILLAAFGNNHNPRLISPTFFPLAVILGTIAVATRWTTSRILATIATAILMFQLVVIVAPSPGDPHYKSEASVESMRPWKNEATKRLLWLNPAMVMQRREQWDWGQFRALCQTHQLPLPKVATLGNIDRINDPPINFPWVQAGEYIQIVELWRSASGQPIDWQQVMSIARQNDAIITQPISEDSELDRMANADSQYNNEFIARLQADSQFEKPLVLQMGRFEPVEIFVFFRRL
jgi:4-amino-4-deoxy-L-arabinose transferase-like glycosyltransferase